MANTGVLSAGVTPVLAPTASVEDEESDAAAGNEALLAAEAESAVAPASAPVAPLPDEDFPVCSSGCAVKPGGDALAAGIPVVACAPPSSGDNSPAWASIMADAPVPVFAPTSPPVFSVEDGEAWVGVVAEEEPEEPLATGAAVAPAFTPAVALVSGKDSDFPACSSGCAVEVCVGAVVGALAAEAAAARVFTSLLSEGSARPGTAADAGALATGVAPAPVLTPAPDDDEDEEDEGDEASAAGVMAEDAEPLATGAETAVAPAPALSTPLSDEDFPVCSGICAAGRCRDKRTAGVADVTGITDAPDTPAFTPVFPSPAPPLPAPATASPDKDSPVCPCVRAAEGGDAAADAADKDVPAAVASAVALAPALLPALVPALLPARLPTLTPAFAPVALVVGIVRD